MDTTSFDLYMEILKKELPVGESFDLLERKLIIGGRRASMFFVDGLTDGEKTQRILAYLMAVPAAGLYGISSSHRFIETTLPFLDTTIIEPKNGSGGSSSNKKGAVGWFIHRTAFLSPAREGFLHGVVESSRGRAPFTTRCS